MSNLYLHPALASDPQLILAVETIMRVTAIIEGHRVRLEPQRRPAEIININTATDGANTLRGN